MVTYSAMTRSSRQACTRPPRRSTLRSQRQLSAASSQLSSLATLHPIRHQRSRVPAPQWVACSVGQGAKGRRLDDWTRIQLASPATSELGRWLLVRRSRSDGELAFYACYGPAATPLVGRVRVAGTRWAVEEGFEQAKGEVGLDHYQVRRWPGWYRHVTLALLAHAFLAVTRAQASGPERARGATAA